jgi:hypothetical protein
MNRLSQEEKARQLAINSIDVHCHGIGRFDFTEIAEINLTEIEAILAKRKHKTILTLYLPENSFEKFFDLIEQFSQGKNKGQYPHIQGFGLEGPLLASHGGTPQRGVWMPSKAQWQRLAQAGKKGLVYVILSPDATLPNGASFNMDKPPKDVAWIIETLLSGDVLPTPGHFTKDDPAQSAESLQLLFDLVKEWGKGPTMTDHLFNDMPHNFKHAWRTQKEKAQRSGEIAQLQLDEWTLDNIDKKLGPVPATMVRNAKQGLVKIAQNFDGEHVDLAVVKKAVALIGAENMLMMTDSIESKRLAGRDLMMKEGSTLLYQNEGVVAAGSQNVIHQIDNMLSIGLTEQQIHLITHGVPTTLIHGSEGTYAQAIGI